MKRVLGLIVTLLIFFGVGYAIWLTRENQKTHVPTTYQVMDDLEEKGLFGRGIEFTDINCPVIKVDDYKDRIVIFSFWATWCSPCVDEFPSFIKLLDEFPNDVVLFAISHDDKEKDVRDFINAFKGWRKNMKVVFDNDKAVSQSLGVGLLPEGYVFNRQGKLVKKILGIQDWASPPAIEYFKTL